MRDTSIYRHYILATVKVKLGPINSFRSVYVSSLTCSLFLLFSLLSREEKPHFYFCYNMTRTQGLVHGFRSSLDGRVFCLCFIFVSSV